MPTQSQTDANRRNAGHSTGPRTPQGLAISSNNRIAHCLAAVERMLPDENPADVFSILEQLRDTLKPANLAEDILVDRMACAYHRLRRAGGWEAGAIRLRMELNPILERLQEQGEKGPENFALLTDATSSNLIPKIDRHEEILRREYDRCLRQLRNLRTPKSKKIRIEPKI